MIFNLRKIAIASLSSLIFISVTTSFADDNKSHSQINSNQPLMTPTVTPHRNAVPHVNVVTPHVNTVTPHVTTITPHVNVVTPQVTTVAPHVNTTVVPHTNWQQRQNTIQTNTNWNRNSNQNNNANWNHGGDNDRDHHRSNTFIYYYANPYYPQYYNQDDSYYYETPSDTSTTVNTETTTQYSDSTQPYDPSTLPNGSWLLVNGGSVPDKALVFQMNNGSPTYYCRVQYNFVTHYGVLSPGNGCFIQDGSNLLHFDEYEVLISSDLS